eukprot:3713365-Amphidinium_carterae.1
MMMIMMTMMTTTMMMIMMRKQHLWNAGGQLNFPYGFSQVTVPLALVQSIRKCTSGTANGSVKRR